MAFGGLLSEKAHSRWQKLHRAGSISALEANSHRIAMGGKGTESDLSGNCMAIEARETKTVMLHVRAERTRRVNLLFTICTFEHNT